MIQRTLRRGLALVVFTFAFAVLPGCGGNGSSPPSPNPSPVEPPAPTPTPAASTPTGGGGTPVAGQAKWTYMAYMAADNTLSDMAVFNLQQMLKAKSSDAVNVVVQVEISPKTDPAAAKVTARGRIKNGDEDLSDMDRNVDMSKAASLTEFIQWAKKTYPAEHYVLDLWSHGGGWRMAGASRGVLSDDTSSPGRMMSIEDVASAIKASGGKVDLLAFDACLMAMYEVGYALKDSATWMVGSEEVIPGTGFPYDRLVNRMVENPTVDPKALAQGMVQDYDAFYRGDFAGHASVQLSALDLTKMSNLHAKTQAFATSLSTHLSSQRIAIEAAREASPSFDIKSYHDLAKFADEVATRTTEAALRTSATQAAAAARESVIANQIYLKPEEAGSAMKASTGLSIYVPKASQVSSAELNAYNALGSNATTSVSAGQKTWGQFAHELVTGNGVAPGQTQTSGTFGYYIAWDNPQVDLDLLVNEPQGQWAGPAEGTSSTNAFSSADSWASGTAAEYYVTNDQLEAGQYDAFVNHAGCHKGVTSCGGTKVNFYRFDPKKGDTDWVLVTQRVMSATPALPEVTSWNDFIAKVSSDKFGDWFYPSNTQRSTSGEAKGFFGQYKALPKALRSGVDK